MSAGSLTAATPQALPRSARSAVCLVDLAGKYGVPARRVLADVGLDAGRLKHPDAELTADQERHIIENVIDTLGHDHPRLGLEAVERRSLSAFGAVGFAFMCGPTLRASIDVALRYQELASTLAHASATRQDGYTWLAFHLDHLPPKMHHFVVDQCMVTALRHFHEAGAQGTPKIELARRDRDSEAAYSTVLQVRPRLGRPADRFGWPDADLDRPRFIDPLALPLLERDCEEQLSGRRASQGVAGVVRGRLRDPAGSLPTMQTIAADLHVSTRTLRRTLTIEGTTFRNLLDEVRYEQARSMLATGTPVKRVAASLGFSSSSSFGHAFKRWTSIA